MFKKLLISLLAGLIILLSFAPYAPAFAESQSTWYSQNPLEWYIKVYSDKVSAPNEIFGERYTAAQVQWVIYSLISLPINAIMGNNTSLVSCIFGGAGKAVLLDTCKEDFNGIITTFNSIFDEIEVHKIIGVAPASVWSLALNTTNRPISGIAYVKGVVNKLKPVSEVKAQSPGFGYDALGTVRNLWKGIRDVSYFIFIIAVIVMAFMIMFRVKINPQTVISVQSALPKVAIALILITFSYAIAGFMVDLMYVFIGLLSTLLYTAGFAVSAWHAYWVISGEIPVISAVAGSFMVLIYMIDYIILFIIAVLGALLQTISSLSVFGILTSIIALVIVVWLAFLALVYTIKIPYVLIKTLIQVYLLVIIAPLQIALGVIVPSVGFGAWLKNLISNLLVFPTVGLLFYLAFYFLVYSFKLSWEGFIEQFFLVQIFGLKVDAMGVPGHFWSPPLLGSGAQITSLVFIFMSFGIIALIPKASELIKSLIMGERFTFGTAMGEATGVAKGAWGMTAQPYVRSFQEGWTKKRIHDFSTNFTTEAAKTGTWQSKTPKWAQDLIGKFP